LQVDHAVGMSVNVRCAAWVAAWSGTQHVRWWR
jgi:hypothetical protein